MKTVIRSATLLVCSVAIAVSGCVSSSQMNAAKSMAPGPADADAPAEFSSTTTGLKYKILRKSDGKMPTERDMVTVNYKGWLDDGREFDSSYKRGEPTSFGLNEVIPGWTQGLQLIGEGGMIELEIPPEIGYGTRGMPGAIPPNSRLHFIVELIKVH